MTAIAAAGWLTRGESRRPVDFADARFTLLANWEGTEEGAEISPDGEFVAFLSDRAGEFDIWETRVGTGVFTNLTEHIPAARVERIHRQKARILCRRQGHLVQSR